MDKYRIEAYCEKPDCIQKTITAVVPDSILKIFKVPNYSSYEPPECQNLVDKLKEEFSALESKFRNVNVDVKDDFDMSEKIVDGAIIYSKDNATEIELNWDDPTRINATVRFDNTHNHPYEEYLKLKKIMRKLSFHILKQKD